MNHVVHKKTKIPKINEHKTENKLTKDNVNKLIYKDIYHTIRGSSFAISLLQITLQNHALFTMEIGRLAIEHGRALRMQPYNEYRKRFGQYPLDNINQMTSEWLFYYTWMEYHITYKFT